MFVYNSKQYQQAGKNNYQVLDRPGPDEELQKIINDHEDRDVNEHYVIVKKHAIMILSYYLLDVSMLSSLLINSFIDFGKMAFSVIISLFF